MAYQSPAIHEKACKTAWSTKKKNPCSSYLHQWL